MHQAKQPPLGQGWIMTTGLEPPVGLERSGEEGSIGGRGEKKGRHVQRKRSSRGWISTSTSSLPIAAANRPGRVSGSRGAPGEIETATLAASAVMVGSCACGACACRAGLCLGWEKKGGRWLTGTPLRLHPRNFERMQQLESVRFTFSLRPKKKRGARPLAAPCRACNGASFTVNLRVYLLNRK
jgi:hypothetical protein